MAAPAMAETNPKAMANTSPVLAPADAAALAESVTATNGSDKVKRFQLRGRSVSSSQS
jgi:hypothetical protein